MKHIIITFFALVMCLIAQDNVPTVTFSLTDQVFTEPLTLKLHCTDEDAVIRYTTDGGPLTVVSTTTYAGPISITDTIWIRAEAKTFAGTSELTSGHYI